MLRNSQLAGGHSSSSLFLVFVSAEGEVDSVLLEHANGLGGGKFVFGHEQNPFDSPQRHREHREDFSFFGRYRKTKMFCSKRNQ
jgi:hypothetical protein